MAKELSTSAGDYTKDNDAITLNPINSVLEGDVEAMKPPQQPAAGNLHRGLKARHISMIALGGSIGTGLIIGTGAALAKAGPASLFLAYCTIGLNVYVTMTAVGEIATYLPTGVGFSGYAARFVDPALGFSLGWNYLFKYLLAAPNQLTAAAIVLQEWVPGDKVNPGVWIAIFMILILAINYIGISYFGEIEFWLSSVKVITFIGIILISLILALGGGPNHDRTGFRYWKDPGAFANYPGIGGGKGKFVAFASIFVNAAFAYLGTELVGVTAGEAERPSHTIPRAIKLTFWRIVVFYCLSILLLGMVVPYNSKELAFANKASTGASASPFVVAITISGIEVLPAIINGAVLLFVLSTANTDLYISSRTLYGLAKTGQAPKFCGYTNQRGVPVWNLVIGTLVSCLAFLNVSGNSQQVFLYFVNVVSIFGMLSWVSILITHIRFIQARRAQGVRDETLAYTAPFGLGGSCVALGFTLLFCLIKNFTVFIPSESYGDFDYKTFITGYIGFPVYIIMYLAWKWYHNTKILKPHQVDLQSDRQRILQEEERYLMLQREAEDSEVGKTRTVVRRVYRRFFSWLM
ncbi:amino acid transporter [Knufia peltigerae]|uniref:Amino acid transporter n=1 Tax=Knufia peltigerae TaxID=1002370 RepID=A0AA39D188_9EURO|nr:amino acid transporter [Knufia peltigerae]